MKKKSTLIAGIILVVLLVAGGILYGKLKPQTTEGAKEITVIVIHGDKSEKEFTYHTDAEYLGEVVVEEGLVKNDQAEFGLYVQTVDGETADGNKQQWWCLTKDGEMLMTGADTTPIQDGDEFEFTLTEGY